MVLEALKNRSLEFVKAAEQFVTPRNLTRVSALGGLSLLVLACSAPSDPTPLSLAYDVNSLRPQLATPMPQLDEADESLPAGVRTILKDPFFENWRQELSGKGLPMEIDDWRRGGPVRKVKAGFTPMMLRMSPSVDSDALGIVIVQPLTAAQTISGGDDVWDRGNLSYLRETVYEAHIFKGVTYTETPQGLEAAFPPDRYIVTGPKRVEKVEADKK